MSRAGWTFLAAVFTVAPPLLGAQAPIPVSPVGTAAVAVVEARCPSFSWSSVEGAAGFELAVYSIHSTEVPARPTVERTLPSGVTSWTPTRGQCLTRGERYAWAVRAVFADRAGDWSQPVVFEVESAPWNEEIAAFLEGLKAASPPPSDAGRGRERTRDSRRRDDGARRSASEPLDDGKTPAAAEASVLSTAQMVLDGDVQVVTKDSPRLRLEQFGGVYPHQIWDVYGNELWFRVVNQTAGWNALTIYPDGVISGNGAGLDNVTASGVLPSAITSSSIAPGAVQATDLGTIYVVNVRCEGGDANSGCSDSTLGQICDTASSNSRPIAVGCRLPQYYNPGTACGGDNICRAEVLDRSDALSQYCRENDTAADATVSCLVN